MQSMLAIVRFCLQARSRSRILGAIFRPLGWERAAAPPEREDFSSSHVDEEVGAWFVAFLKSVAVRLHGSSARLFLDTATGDFPIFVQVAARRRAGRGWRSPASRRGRDSGRTAFCTEVPQVFYILPCYAIFARLEAVKVGRLRRGAPSFHPPVRFYRKAARALRGGAEAACWPKQESSTFL